MHKMTLNPIETVCNLLRESFKEGYAPTETIALNQCFNRSLAHDFVSSEQIPAFAKSTVDGYAVKYAQKSTPLTLIGEVVMGQPTTLVLNEGTCIKVPTGGMVPHGTDTMIMIEDVSALSDGVIQVNTPSITRDNIIEAGQDMAVGKCVLTKGRVLKTHEIGVLAALGHYHVEVFKKPRLALISTGDELVDESQAIQMGQIREINTYTLAVLAEQMGFEVVSRQILKDDYLTIKQNIMNALTIADCIVISGGSSVGDKDYTYDLLQETCDQGVLVSGMAIKPGKPTIVAKHGHQPVIGLPGHPVSSIVVFEILMTEILNTWGFKLPKPHTTPVTLTAPVFAAKGRDTYQMVNIINENGQHMAYPTSGKSGMITLLTASNGYVVIPKEQKKFEKGESVLGYYFAR